MLVEQQTCPLETLMPENGHFPFKLWSQREIVILFRKRSSLFPKEPLLLLLGCLLSISHPLSYIKHRPTLAYILVWYTTVAKGFFIVFCHKKKDQSVIYVVTYYCLKTWVFHILLVGGIFWEFCCLTKY